MFSRFAAALYSAVDALAPPLPLQEDFIWHWKSVTKYYTSKSAENKLPIEMTSIPGHLLEMLSILEQEVTEHEEGNVGPCMEYIMNHKLLDTMCILATTDEPPGMKRYMLIFVTRFLGIIQQLLIPQISIHVAITNFIKLCGEVPAAPTEKEEMDLLDMLCQKMKENSCLVSCFIGNRASSGQTSWQKQDVPPESAENRKGNIEDHVLIYSLLRLYFSPDKTISSRASECLKLCCSVVDDATALLLVENSNFGYIMCSNIIKLYRGIPKTMKLSEIEDPFSDASDEHRISSEKRKFLCYLQQLNFIDTLVQDAHKLISDSIVKYFKSEFLDAVICTDLVEDQNIDVNLFVTALITTSIRYLSSPKLIATFEFFLFGELHSFDISGHTSHVVKDLLIERCRTTQMNVALSMVTLQLFEEILQRPTQDVLQNLIIGYVDGRAYFDHTAADDWLCFSDDDSTKNADDDGNSLPEASPINKTFAPPHIHRILDAFLSLVPDELKSAETEEDSGYETYIKEAHGRFIKCLMHCEVFDWPQEPLSREEIQVGVEDDSSSDSQPEAESSCWRFYEGPFLSMLFEKLEHMLELPYDINLQVTSIVSRLALFVHPNLHEYLLNPLIPLGPHVRSLFSILLKVVEGIQVDVRNIKSFTQKLRLTRKSLLSDESSSEPFDESNILEVLIVIEEFCKELAAITFVKYNAAS